MGDRCRPNIGRPRLLLLAPAALILLAFTRPGTRARRRLARRLDSRVDGFSESNASAYARLVAPAMRRLYERVARDVIAEWAGSGDGARGRDGGYGRDGSGGHGRDGSGVAILDIGCGPGDLAALLAKRLPSTRIVGLDLSPSMVELARRRETADGRLRFELGDAAGMPFEAESFDVVVSTLSLHHWPDPGAGFAEIGRVLRPGGVALVYDLRLLTLEAETLPDVARRAGLPASRLRFERLGGGLPASFFVRFRIDRPIEDPAGYVNLAAPAAGHARIPAAVTPGEVA